MSRSYDAAVIGERYGLNRPPTLFAREASVAPIVFTQLKNDRPIWMHPKAVVPESAFSIGVLVRPMSGRYSIEGQEKFGASSNAGDIFMFDLSRNPLHELLGPFHIVRFYISQLTLDELSHEEGSRGSMEFANPPLGVPDRTMYGLALSLMSRIENPGERSTLFLDHIALAFHAHIKNLYGKTITRHEWPQGSLAPWQLRRALDFLLARLAADPSVTDVARECGLSAGYFTRAFRKTTGVTPYQWVIERRVERARSMMASGDAPLAQIAVACGFNDQSHFTRVFTQREGCPPGNWRLLNRGSAATFVL